MALPQLPGALRAIRSGTICESSALPLTILHHPSPRKCLSFEIVSIELHPVKITYHCFC
jgi:hypothetical protein